MNCLKDYVGLKYPGAPVPKSNMYINSLAGITTQMLDMIAAPEQVANSIVWNEIQEIAWTRLYTDVVSSLRSMFQLKQINQSIEQRVSMNDSPSIDAQSAGFHGIKIRFGRITASFEAVLIHKIYFRSPEQRSANLRVLNASNVILLEKPIDVVIGMNEILIDDIFADDEIFFGIDAGPAGTYSTEMKSIDLSCFCMTVRACRGNCEPSIVGATFDNDVITETTNKNHAIGYTASLICDYSALICHNKPMFLSAWLFLLGNQTLIELMASSRVNQFTTVDRDQYVELKDHYQVEYESQLKTIIKGIRINDSCCVVCDPKIKYVPWLP
jgi:hypothetical protein